MLESQQEFREPFLLRVQTHVALALGMVLIAGSVWLLDSGREADTANGATDIRLAGSVDGAAPRVGDPAPNFSLETLDGRTTSLSDWRGHPVLINFWASWCPPCRGEMPDLQSVSQEYRGAGLVVLAINLAEDQGAVERYAGTLGLSFQIVLDRSSAVANRYNLTALPTSYFVDRDGITRDLNIGALTAKGLRNKVSKIVQ